MKNNEWFIWSQLSISGQSFIIFQLFFNHLIWLTGDASNDSVGSGDSTDGFGDKNKLIKIQSIRLNWLTVKCWNNHALRIFVATLGKMPLFLAFFLLVGSSSSQPSVPSPLPTLALLASPVNQTRNDWKTVSRKVFIPKMFPPIKCD